MGTGTGTPFIYEFWEDLGSHFGDPGPPLGPPVASLGATLEPVAPLLRCFLATSVVDPIFPSFWGAHWREKVTFSGRADVLET